MKKNRNEYPRSDSDPYLAASIRHFLLVLPLFFRTANRPVSIVQFLTRRVIDWNWKRRRMANGKDDFLPRINLKIPRRDFTLGDYILYF